MNKIEALKSVYNNLNQRDQQFAKSLLDQEASRGLTDKQWYWVVELAKRGNLSKNIVPMPSANLDGFKPIVDMLYKAKEHKESPAILVQANDKTFRLNIAGETARQPGSINVCTPGGYGNNVWYGRIYQDGRYEPSPRIDNDLQNTVIQALRAMADDPLKAAAEYGHKTHTCCFCGIKLTHPSSKERGYGPVCAKNHGLVWGGKKAA